MKAAAIVALLVCGIIMRAHGWKFVAQEHKGVGFTLVLGGTLLTLGIVAVLAYHGSV